MGILNKWTQKKEKEQREKMADSSGKEKKVAPATTSDGNRRVEGVVLGAGSVIRRPYVSEKAIYSEKNGVYTFEVSIAASKVQIADAVKELYGIRPSVVRVQNVEGKWGRFGRARGRKRDWKKAIVTLPKGKTLSIHEGV